LAYWLIRQRMVNECFILNNTNLATMFSTAVNADYRQLRTALPVWTLFYTVAGYEYFPEQRVESHIQDIAGISQRLNTTSLRSVDGISANEILKAVQLPSTDPYWKLRPRGGCEDIFYLTQREKLAAQIGTMTGLAEKSCYAATDLGVYIQPIVQGTSWHCEFNLFYEPGNGRECIRVQELAGSAMRKLMEQGAFFSRPYGENSGMILNRDGATVNVLHTFKKIFDPNNIMNPGKVCF
ncbi:MAG: FAD-binding domain protein, partial [Gammaproteobacteria bacterium]|nr:FAD-binding domain protein [Gammaproteobacteria bacterium]